MRHYVYEMLGADGAHLYIGCTRNIAQRLKQHMAERDWFRDVTRFEVDQYPDERSARDAERERIELYKPIHNYVFTEKHNAGGWSTRRARMQEQHAAGDLCHESFCRDCTEKAHGWKVRCGNPYRCMECAVADWPHMFEIENAYDENAGITPPTLPEHFDSIVTRRRELATS
jgi:hypothetical protein